MRLLTMWHSWYILCFTSDLHAILNAIHDFSSQSYDTQWLTLFSCGYKPSVRDISLTGLNIKWAFPESNQISCSVTSAKNIMLERDRRDRKKSTLSWRDGIWHKRRWSFPFFSGLVRGVYIGRLIAEENSSLWNNWLYFVGRSAYT